MAKEEEEQRRIVADCLRRYAELMAPPVRVPVATSQKSVNFQSLPYLLTHLLALK